MIEADLVPEEGGEGLGGGGGLGGAVEEEGDDGEGPVQLLGAAAVLGESGGVGEAPSMAA